MAYSWKELRLESKAVANQRHMRLSSSIFRSGVTSATLGMVAGCLAGARCGLDGCPVCMRRFRKHLVQAVQALDLPPDNWCRISIIPRGALFAPGRLSNFNPLLASKAIGRRLGRSCLSQTLFIGGWDASFNQFENVDIGWQMHLYGLINHPNPDDLKAEIRQVLELDPMVKRPLHVKEVEQQRFLEGVTYAHKSLFSRRSGYFESNRLRAGGGPRRNALDQPLKSAQMLELTEWLSCYQVGSRLILRNLKRVSPPGAKVRLKRMRPPE